MRTIRLLTIMAVCMAAGLLRGQAPAPVAPATAPADPAKLPVRERERTVYVPYDELEKVFQDGGKGVFLPYREFLELWNELSIKRAEDKEQHPPVDGVVSRADYTGRIEGQTLILDGKITVESFAKAWNTISLSRQPLTGISEAATGKAVLRPTDKGWDLIVPEKGVYEITLKLMLPVEQIAGRSKVSLAVPQAAVSRMVITVPGEGLEFQVEPSAAFTSRPLGAGQTELSFFSGGTSASTSLSWGTPQGSTTMTPLLLAETKVVSKLGAGSIATTAELGLRILRAPMNEIKISLPAGQEVLGVTGQDIKNWAVAAGAAGRQTLTITPGKPVRDDYRLQLTLEGPIASLPAEVAVPDLQIEGASYARGSAELSTEPQFDVTPKTLTSVVRSSTQAQAAQGLLSAGTFRLLKQPYTLTLQVEEAKPQVEVTSLAHVDIQRDAAAVSAQFDFNVRRVGIFEARIGLPAGLNVSTVTSDAISEWKVEPAPSPTLLVKLKQQHTGAFNVKLNGRQLRANATEDAVLPVFTPQSVTRHEAKLGVAVHSSLEANTKGLGDLQQEDVNALPNDARQSTAGLETTLAFRYRDAAKPATLGFKSRDPQVMAEILTLIEAKEQSTRHTWTLSFDVSYAAIDRLVLAVPKAIAKDIRFADPSVKETNREYQPSAAEQKLPGAADYAFWQVILRNEKLGSFTLTLSHEKLSTIEAGKTGTVDLLQIHAPGAFNETGQVAVLKDNALELRKSTPEGLEEIDARELHGPLQTPGVFQAYKYRALPVKLTVETAKNAYFKVPQAVITHADVSTAVATDEAQATEVIYWVKNIDLQFLVVALPKGATLGSDIFVGRESQHPMRREGSENLLIRLPTGGTATREAFPVRFVFQTPSSHPGVTLGTSGALTISPSEVQEVKIFETRHRLYLPESTHYTAFNSPLTQVLPERGWPRISRTLRYVLPRMGASMADRIIADLANAQSENTSSDQWSNPPQVPNDVRTLYDFQIPQQGHREILRRLGPPATVEVAYRSKSLTFAYEAVAFILVLLIGLMLLRASLTRKLTVALLIGVIAALSLGVLAPANTLIAIAALRSLLLVLIVWFLLCALPKLYSWWKNRPKKAPPAPQPPRGPSGPHLPNNGNQAPPPPPPPATPASDVPHQTRLPATPTPAAGASNTSPIDVIQIPEVQDAPPAPPSSGSTNA